MQLHRPKPWLKQVAPFVVAAGLLTFIGAYPALGAGGYKPAGPGNAQFNDPYTPASGTFTVAGYTSSQGLLLPSATNPAGTNAYVNYDGTNVNINTPTGKGFVFNINGGSDFGSITATNAAGVALKYGTHAFTQGSAGGTEGNGFLAADSGFIANGTTLPAATNYYVAEDGNNLNLNVPSGKGFILTVAQTNVAQFGGTAKNLSVGDTAADLTNVNGQINASHLAGGSGAPTSPTAGTGCGTSSAPTNAGSDLAGQLGVTCGTAGTAGNHYVTITFAHAYNTAPYCQIHGANAQTESSTVSDRGIAVTSTTQLSVDCGTGGTCNTGTLLWVYHCDQ